MKIIYYYQEYYCSNISHRHGAGQPGGRRLEEEDAVCLAKDWLFNNPNRFFNLGFKEI
jgi:hypothetical protein